MLTKYFVVLIISVYVDAIPTFISSKNLAENYDRPHGWDKQRETYKSTENLQNNLIKKALEQYTDQDNEFIPTAINKCLHEDNDLSDKINCIKNFIRENEEGEMSNLNRNINGYSYQNYDDYHDLKRSELADTKAMFTPSIPSKGNPYTLQQNKQYPRPELQILQLIKQKTNDLKLGTMKRCFQVKNDNDRKLCMKEMVEKTGRQGMEDSNSSVNEYDNEKFSQDYIDVNDLLRNNKKMDDKKTKKKIMFKIVPNENKFSRFDYDLTGMRKFNPKKEKEILRNNHDSNKKNNKKRIIFKIAPNENKLSKFDKKDNKVNNILRTYQEDYDDSDSSSSEEHTKQNNVKIAHQVQSTVNSDSDESSSYEDIRNKRKIKAKVEPAVYYMQGPSRMYGEDSRRRLPHFLPKRYYWDEDDMRELNNFWFQGPQGKYPGHYKSPY